MKIIGLDVCKNAVVCCVLTDDIDITEPRQLYYDLDFPKVYATPEGIKQLLQMKPDVAVLEPSGGNYSKLWVTKLAEAGVTIALVGHKQLRSFRENLDLPDKDDPADALALAIYYRQHAGLGRRFVQHRDPIIAQIRDIGLRLHHLNRLQSPAINRIKQDLAWQFPERASTDTDAVLFWGWLAGERKSARYDLELENTCGLGLHPETRNNAKLICQIKKRELALELQMRELMSDSRFTRYRRVFAEFGFGQRVEALILSQIYPLENYLLDGKPEVRIRTGKRSGKQTKRYLSLRRFQKALGVAPTREESGDKKMTRRSGSTLCRTALWQWIFTRYEPSDRYPKNEVGKKIKQWLTEEKQRHPVKLARSRTAAKAVALLFKKLVEAIDEGNSL